ncbi:MULTISPECIES: class F sortase [Streptomyces]|uniref:Class F sortase n=1 Tax=Streptomyces solicathayae TaxID=3081768 RepID=A0ABZ0LN77_9ACTN|nr:class F sortase [Streptomyces sp. HUAS YS2]WOX20951.1 class F sortase [Streptomyces sp. HUAS YS2]
MPAVFWTVVLAALLFFFGPGLAADDEAPPARPPAAPARVDSAAGATREKVAPASAGPAMPRSAPTRLRIPEIGVDAPFTALKIGASGALEPPPADDTNLVGWHAAGTSPGERGTAVVAGHLDTVTSPAVFARLGELGSGDRFEVQRTDGTTARFVVDSVETFRKDDFPDERVYEDTPAALVRLITCAGPYDREAKDYTENLVVFAHLENRR